MRWGLPASMYRLKQLLARFAGRRLYDCCVKVHGRRAFPSGRLRVQPRFELLANAGAPPLGTILDAETGHLALPKTEDVTDRLKPVRLPLERFAFEITDGLPNFCDDRAIRSSMKAYTRDVRTDQKTACITVPV